MRYDELARELGEAFDLRGSTLATLVTCALKDGRLSKRRRDQFQHEVPRAAFELLDARVRAMIDGLNDDVEAPTQ